MRRIEIMYFRFLYNARNTIKALKMAAIITLTPTFEDFTISVYLSRSYLQLLPYTKPAKENISHFCLSEFYAFKPGPKVWSYSYFWEVFPNHRWPTVVSLTQVSNLQSSYLAI